MSGMLTVGITGRSGSGKSAVAAHYRARGRPVADADAVSREVCGAGSACLGELVRCFGAGILTADETLNRGALAALAFADEGRRARLAEITHPYIIAELLRLRERARAAGARLFFADGAMIVGSPFRAYCDALIAVTAPRRLLISRIVLRDGVSKEAAVIRLNAQPCEAALLNEANYVIENTGSAAALCRRADEVLEQLLLYPVLQGY